jgi:hypothetical protein
MKVNVSVDKMDTGLRAFPPQKENEFTSKIKQECNYDALSFGKLIAFSA